MFTNFIFYLIGIFIFKLYTEVLFNYDRSFNKLLPERYYYDFIIVGSGTAGSLLASDLNGSVIVIEAGSKGDSFLFNIPVAQPMLQKSSFDWNFATTTQENACKALNKNQSRWPMGMIQGGSHRLNNMIYHRGHHSDYEHFITKLDADQLFHENEKHSPASPGLFHSAVSEAFIEAGKSLGFEDFDFTNLTHLKGRRFTQIDRWKLLKNPPEICLNARVTRVIFDDNDFKKAIGVEYKKQGQLHRVYGKRVVLSAGVIGSPKILLHSGIGPKEHLNDIGIEMRENLPVGENLQDHVTTAMDLILLNQTVGLSLKNLMNPFKILDYFWYNGEGSPLSFAGSDAMGFVKLNNSNGNDIPDLSFMLLPVGLVTDHGLHLRKIINIRDEIWNKHFKPLIGQTAISILPILLHPKSKGTVRLQSKDFLDPPIINPNYLREFDDVKRLLTGIRIIEKLVETPAMEKFGAEINPKPFPGCEKHFFDSNDYWECYIRHMTLTMFHPVGTCKLGDLDDNSTVVLKNFQVKNIENLFVVDGSVLPHTTSANPHAIIAMIAQKFVYDMSH